mgnify:CR=1 FL=1
MNKNIAIIITSILVIGLIWYFFLGEKKGGIIGNAISTIDPFDEYGLGTLNISSGDDMVLGCTLEGALNYSEEATNEDGSCVFEMGCCDITASNYDPMSNSCDVPGNNATCNYDNGEWSPSTLEEFFVAYFINALDGLILACESRDDCELKTISANPNAPSTTSVAWRNMALCQNPYGCLMPFKMGTDELVVGFTSDGTENGTVIDVGDSGLYNGEGMPLSTPLDECLGFYAGCQVPEVPYEFLTDPIFLTYSEQLDDVNHGVNAPVFS